MAAGRSEFSPEGQIFISYSRADGRAFAEVFERKLEKAGIRSWRDIRNMESGDILPQVLRAIEEARHLVLVLSRRALKSDWIRREWTHARLKGRRVSPVLADPAIKRSDLPAWIRREEVYDIAEPERWRSLVRVLEGPGEVRRVRYMEGHLPDPFVRREREYAALKEAVLKALKEKEAALAARDDGAAVAVGVTAAAYGASSTSASSPAWRRCCASTPRR